MEVLLHSLGIANTMHRYGRTEFFAFGLLQVVNALALLIRGLFISTSGNHGEGQTIPVLVGLVGYCLVVAAIAAVRRGHDIAWSAKLTLPAFILAVGLGPIALVLVLVLALARGRPDGNSYGLPPRAMNANRWSWAVVLLAIPWVALLVMARLV